MNILTDTLPKTVNICGKMYPIETDFRVWVSFEMLLQKSKENIREALAPCFPDSMIPSENAEDVAAAVIDFYCCGKTAEKKKEKPTRAKQGYSFEVDNNIIFADFWNFYNIDLSQEGLHWWVFRSLMDGLPEKSEFKQRVYYRTCDIKGMTKKERERIMKIRSMIEIKKDENAKMTLEERNSQMLAYVAKRGKETGGGENG